MMWQHSRISPDRTHHVCDDIPLYDQRFDEVLEFQEPGLAAVARNGLAWHIDVDATPAYGRRFERTFGFYENIAAVMNLGDWHHIRIDGSELYDVRYDWCGNFQDQRCTVRTTENKYFHIRPDGTPAYFERWRYAGDFRDGMAVVQNSDGHSTHIDRSGREIHGVCFRDLDVYHKGFARARDHHGWMHIDLAGNPLYERRFATVEPFYNGQARVEDFFGRIEVIDESGNSLIELHPATASNFSELSDDLVGFWRTQTIRTAVKLEVIEALPASEGQIAQKCALEHEYAGRILRALAELGLTAFSLWQWRTTEKGEYLKRDHTLTLADAALEYGECFTHKWEHLPDMLRAKIGPYSQDYFSSIACDADRLQSHHRALKSYALHDYGEVPRNLRLKGKERVVDAGGGTGSLAFLLLEEYPELSITILDRPEVISMVEQSTNSVNLHAANIFEDWGIKVDVVVMARVLHDWNDNLAIQILRNARNTLPQGGKLFLVEMVLPEDGTSGGLCDLHLLVSSGGKERTVSEFKQLFSVSGFEFSKVQQISALLSIIVGVAQ